MAEWIRSLNDASIPFILWLQRFRSGPLDAFMAGMSWLGAEYFYIVFIPFLYWVISKRWGVLVALSLSISSYMGEYIKWMWKLPRPGSPPVAVLWSETSPGFVSTHAAPAVAVWGALALCVRRWWFTAIALLLILAISLSRPYLGVHFPADIVGGWLVGALTLLIVFRLIPRLEPRLRSWSVGRQIAAVLLLGAVLLIIFPGDWDGNRPAESGARSAGMLTGFLLGLIWDANRLHFEAGGRWTTRLLRYLAGMLLLVVFYFGLRVLFSPFSQGAYLVEQGFRLIRYAIVGLTISGLGPWLFGKLRLA